MSSRKRTKKTNVPRPDTSSSSGSSAAAADAAAAAAAASAVDEVPVVHNTTLDFDSYINRYTGFTKVRRAVFIAARCPELALKAWRAAITEIKTTLDTDSFTSLVSQAREAVGQELGDEYGYDEEWLKRSNRAYVDQMGRLENDLSARLKDSIRDRIRAGYLEMARLLLKRGDFAGAVQRLLETKNYSSTDSDTLETYLLLIFASLNTDNMGYVKSQADRALAMPLIQQRSLDASRCRLSLAIFEIRRHNYRAAADQLLRVNAEIADQYSEVIAGEDVAMYATVCMLHTYSRDNLKQALAQQEFRKFLDIRPEFLTLLQDFANCRFAAVFHTLAVMESDFRLDLHIGDSIPSMIKRIRDRALMQYFAPFVSINIPSMATAFGITESDLEQEVTHLIGEKRISARIDSHNKVLYARNADHRVQTFQKALAAGKEYVRNSKSLLLRMSLLRHDIVVRQTKPSEPVWEDTRQRKGTGKEKR